MTNKLSLFGLNTMHTVPVTLCIILKYSYHYLMSNAFLYGKNKALAKEYADKILAIDPEYAPAQQIRDLK